VSTINKLCNAERDSKYKDELKTLTYEKQVTMEVKRIDTLTSACIVPTSSKALSNT